MRKTFRDGGRYRDGWAVEDMLASMKDDTKGIGGHILSLPCTLGRCMHVS